MHKRVGTISLYHVSSVVLTASLLDDIRLDIGPCRDTRLRLGCLTPLSTIFHVAIQFTQLTRYDTNNCTNTICI